MDLAGLSEHSPRLELLPTLVDRLAREEPSRTWASFPNDAVKPSQGYRSVSFAEFANYINRAAWFFEKHVGKPSARQFPVVAYIGPSDVRYHILTVAAIKCGLQILLLSEATSISACLHVLQQADCKTFFHASQMKDHPILAQRLMHCIEVPEVDDVTASQLVPHFAYDKSPEDGLNEPLMLLHTSGSSGATGLPKMVPYTQGYAALNALKPYVPECDGRRPLGALFQEATRLYSGFRIAHSGGTFFAFRMLYHGVGIVTTGTDPGSLSSFEAALDYGNIDGALLTPHTLREVAKSPKCLEKLQKLKFIASAGGPVPKQVGDIISQKTRLVNNYGSTEHHDPTFHVLEAEDYAYNHFNPRYNNIRWRDAGNDLFEPIIVRHSDPVLRHYQAVFWAFPELDEWPMGDLFSKHPTKPNVWKYEGRADDLIITDSGLNYLPTYYEQQVLEKDPRVRNAVIFGSGQQHLAVIIDLVHTPSSEAGRAEAQDDLWPLIQECNDRAMKGLQIPKHAVIIAHPQKPFPKGGKGSVQRPLTEQIYSAELREVFGVAN